MALNSQWWACKSEFPWTPKLDVKRKGIQPWPEATRGIRESPTTSVSPATTWRVRGEYGECGIDHLPSGGSSHGVLIFSGNTLKLPVGRGHYKGRTALDSPRTSRYLSLGPPSSPMTRSHRWLQVLATASLAAATLRAQSPGDNAPAFSLQTLDGGPASLSDYAGHPVLINFWASWCKPCSGEMPLIIAAYRAHQQAGLAVLAIDLTDQEASTKDIRKFQAEFQIPFPVLLDKKGKARKLYRLRGVPTSVFVGSDGVIRSINPGPISEAALQQHLAEIMPAP